MNISKELILLTIGVFLFSTGVRSCHSEGKKSVDEYRNKQERCRQACLPKPYDPKYFPNQCVCMDGTAK